VEHHLTYEERLKQQQVAAKAAILAQCDRLGAARVTFVAVHFDGSGDDGVTEEIKCYDSDVYAYEECEHVARDASELQEHFDALVPYGYENDAGGFGDVVLDVRKRKIIVERNDASRTTQRRVMRSSHGSSAEACAE
jgi:hypothetical protein